MQPDRSLMSTRPSVLPAALWLCAAAMMPLPRAAAQEVWNENARLKLNSAVAHAAGRDCYAEASADELTAKANVAELLRAAIAIGSDDLQQQAALLTQANLQLQSIAELAQAGQSLSQRSSALLEGLHDQFLTGEYRPQCPGLYATLLRGDYNCLTAATLLLLAAERAGLECQIYERPGHVWCLVQGGGQQCQVETLVADGAQPVIGGVSGRPLSRRQVLARLYYNAALSALDARAFGRALVLSDSALRLDASYARAWHNLATALNNWAVELSRQGRSAAALELLQAGTALMPAQSGLQRNLAALQAAERSPALLQSPGDVRSLPSAD